MLGKKEAIARFEPVNIKLEIPPVKAKGEWKNEIALALIGILLTFFTSLLSLFYNITSSWRASLLFSFGATVLFILILKINFIRGFLNKFVVWWSEMK